MAPCMFFLSQLIAFIPSSSPSSSKINDCSWFSPKTIRKQNDTDETQLTSRVDMSMPDWVRDRNCWVIEKGTLARTKPAKKEFIQAMAGMVVAIITIMPFMLSIMPDWAACMLFAESTGGLSPLTTRYPVSGLQRKPLRHSKASLVMSMYFLLRLSHLATRFLSLVSAKWIFLTGFLVLVQAPQREQQSLKSWMQQVTQMMGRKTQAIIRSSSRSSPITMLISIIQHHKSSQIISSY